MARYVERAENCSRLLLSTQDLLLDSGTGDEAQFWGPILAATGDEKAFAALYPQVTGAAVTEFLALHEGNPNSIVNCLRAARENARTVRDQISDELWESLNSLRLFANSRESLGLPLTQSASFHERVLKGSAMFQGIAASTIPRGEAWYFLRLGTCLERADKMSRLLDTCSALPLEIPPHPKARPLRWAALLRSCSAWHAFQAYSSRLEPVRIIQYLLLDPTFPRSVACAVNEVHETLLKLCGFRPEGDLAVPVRLAGRLQADLAYTPIEEIIGSGLHDFIDELQTRLNQIGDAIFHAFVLYADLLPVATSDPAWQPRSGAWHSGDAHTITVQQQQQQQ